MSSKPGTTGGTATAPPPSRGRQGGPDKRRGRSRSPSAYLKKSGKSIKGFLSGDHNKKKDRQASLRKHQSLPALGGGSGRGSTTGSTPSSPISVTSSQSKDTAAATEKVVIETTTNTNESKAAVEVTSTAAKDASTAAAVASSETTTPKTIEVKTQEDEPKVILDAPSAEEEDDEPKKQQPPSYAAMTKKQPKPEPKPEATPEPADEPEQEEEPETKKKSEEPAVAAAEVVPEPAEKEIKKKKKEEISSKPPSTKNVLGRAIEAISSVGSSDSKAESSSTEPKKEETKTKEVEDTKTAAEEDNESTTPKPSKNILNKAFDAINAGINAVTAANPQEETPTPKPEPEKKTMQLLLMEPKSRRFELLQLEFNPDKALVQDILSQVAVTATEDPLRTQEYGGICSVDGKEIDQSNLLKDFINEENEFAIAIPTGFTGKEVTSLASPILQDPKIKSMFRTVLDKADDVESSLPIKLNLVTQPKVEEEEESEEEEAAETEEQSPAAQEKEEPRVEETRSNRAMPNLPTEVTTTTTTTVSSSHPEEAVETDESLEEKDVPTDVDTAVTSPESPARSTRSAVLAGEQEQMFDDDTTTTEDNASGGGISFGTVLVVATIAVIISLGMLMHNAFTSPLNLGDRMEVGQWRSKCGFLAVLPEEMSGCTDMSLELSGDGSLTLYETGNFWNEEKTVLWKLSSTSIDPIEDGTSLEVSAEDGTVLIGGKIPKVVLKSSVDLSPWPFAEDVFDATPRKRKDFFKAH